MKAIPLNDTLYRYIADHCDLPHPILEKVKADTDKHPYSQMQISPDQGMFMHLMAKLIGAKRCLEIGCFTGYSAISVATALPSDGLLISLEKDPEVAKQAQGYFTEAGL